MNLRTTSASVVLTIVVPLLLAVIARADGPADNQTENVRRLPKLGVEVPAEKRAALEKWLAEFAAKLAELQKRSDAKTRELWPDVAVYHKAVSDGLKYQEFFTDKEVDEAFVVLSKGFERAEQLLKGEAPWTTATGLVVRGYVSKIDGSVQPYGLVVPASYTDKTAGRYRVDIWLHGRGEVLSELNFIRDRSANAGTFQPADTIVLHPYGRWNNAFKLAGEVDVLEGLDSVRKRYRVDDDRVAMRGFSMGGAGAWHMAVHYPDKWFAANPGAGFSETPDFLKVFQKQTLAPTWFEQKLWQIYDCPGWAANLRQCPTVVYSGEKDSQKQAADIMEPAFTREGLRMVHVIGPDTAHSYHPAAKLDVESRLANLARGGRQRVPAAIQFVTFTLRYNRCHWLVVDELNEHWEQARVDAKLNVPGNQVSVQTKNTTALSFDFPSGDAPLAGGGLVKVTIDGTALDVPGPASDGSWQASFHRDGETWKVGRRGEVRLLKKHGLQGPIDDAFMDSFLMVHPSGQPYHETTGLWVDAEMQRAVDHWRRHFRGEARVKNDTEVTAEDIANSNLVLWGDPASNQILAKIAGKLPFNWDKGQLQVGDQKYASDRHALVAILPNPLNPNRYVVLNSGFTFRDFAHLNNARQVPMLPDWAVVDLTTPPGSVWPGKIVAADFFDEGWELKAPKR